jgi:hypothetical protein
MLDLMVDHNVDSDSWNELVRRFLELDRSVIQSDRPKPPTLRSALGMRRKRWM